MCEDIHFPFDTSKALGVFSACFTSFVTQKVLNVAQNTRTVQLTGLK